MPIALSRDQILGIQDIKVKELQVPEWNGSVFIRQLTRGEQDEYLKMQFSTTAVETDLRVRRQKVLNMSFYGHDAWLCVHGICDDKGTPIFTDKDLEVLKRKNGEVVGRIASEIVTFSGMAKDVEAAEKAKNS